MPPAESAWVYNVVNYDYDAEEIYNELDGYRSAQTHDKLTDELITTAEDVSREGNYIKCLLKFDAPKQVSTRGDRTQWIPEVHHQNVIFSGEIFDGGVVFHGSNDRRDTAVSRVRDFLGVSQKDLSRIRLSPSNIEEIIEEDCQNPKALSVEDVDEYTSSASASGNVDRSSYAQNIDKRGDTTWQQFTSLTHGKTVGLGTDGIVFYGNGWSDADKMGYIKGIVLDKL